MELLNRLQDWYQVHCDGDWEHSYGVKIDTLDNPGWRLTIDVAETLLEDVDFTPICVSESDFWIDCKKVNGSFVGTGGPDSLEKLLSVFLEWAEKNADTKKWDDEVDALSSQCQNCNSLEEFRKLYYLIDDIPVEHPRKNKLETLFNEKWNKFVDV